MRFPYLARSLPIQIRPRLAVGLLFGQLSRPASTASSKGNACPTPAKEEPKLLSRLFLSPKKRSSRSLQPPKRLCTPKDAHDQKLVLELLTYHQGAVGKMGCGVDYIKVDLYTRLRSRCFFVARTDGGCIDFSYKECLYGYIHTKYPSHAESLLRKLPTILRRWRPQP